MRSQFKPVTVTAAVDRPEHTEPLYAQTRRLQIWLLVLAALVGLIFLSVGLMFLNVERMLSHGATAQESQILMIGRGVLGGMIALLIGSLAVSMLFVRQVWQLVLNMTHHLTEKTDEYMRQLVRSARNTMIWIRVIQIIPIVLTVLLFGFALFVQATAGVDANARIKPLQLVFSVVGLAIQFLILESIRQWVHAVSVNARGSKSLIEPKLSAMNGWTTLWFFSLISSILGGLFTTFMVLRFPMNDLLKGRTNMSFTDAELFARFNGFIQGSAILSMLLSITLLVLLILLRGYASHVTTMLDQRSFHARRQNQDEKMAAAWGQA